MKNTSQELNNRYVALLSDRMLEGTQAEEPEQEKSLKREIELCNKEIALLERTLVLDKRELEMLNKEKAVESKEKEVAEKEK